MTSSPPALPRSARSGLSKAGGSRSTAPVSRSTRLPEVTHRRRSRRACSPRRVARCHVIVPAGLDGGRTPVRVDELPGETAFVESARRSRPGCTRSTARRSTPTAISTSPSADRAASRRRSSIFVVRPDGTREPFVSDLPNPTSLAFDPDGRAVRVEPVRRQRAPRRRRTAARRCCDRSRRRVRHRVRARRRRCIVGDRSGSILRVDDGTRARRSPSLPPSVAAFHLAFGPDGYLYVTGPTLSARTIRSIASRPTAMSRSSRRLRPSAGARVRRGGDLYVVDALAGSSGLYRLRAGGRAIRS